MTEYIWSEDAFKHAQQVYPEECCGLLLDVDGVETYWKCKNISGTYKEKSFVIDPIDYADGEDKGKVVGIVHSHPQNILEFSEQDKFSCKSIGVPFYLVCPDLDKMIVIHPDEINA
jgi:proteasome lid subunit RPN8/RPN11